MYIVQLVLETMSLRIFQVSCDWSTLFKFQRGILFLEAIIVSLQSWRVPEVLCILAEIGQRSRIIPAT